MELTQEQKIQKLLAQQTYLVAIADIEYQCYTLHITKEEFFRHYLWNKCGIPFKPMLDQSEGVEIEEW